LYNDHVYKKNISIYFISSDILLQVFDLSFSKDFMPSYSFLFAIHARCSENSRPDNRPGNGNQQDF